MKDTMTQMQETQQTPSMQIKSNLLFTVTMQKDQKKKKKKKRQEKFKSKEKRNPENLQKTDKNSQGKKL